MSKETKLFARPKVRFTQNIENVEETKESGNKTEQKSIVTLNRPKIRSIVSLKKPVKILNATEKSTDFKIKHSNSTNDRENFEFLTESGDVHSNNSQTISTSCSSTDRVNDQKPLNDTANIQNIKANSEDVDKFQGTEECVKKSTLLKMPALQEDISNKKVPRLTDNINNNTLKVCQKKKSGKENKGAIGNANIKISHVITKGVGNLGNKRNVLKQKPIAQSTSTNLKKSIVTQPDTVKFSKQCSKRNTLKDSPKTTVITATSNASKKLNPKFNVTNVMPCHKYTRVSSKARSSPVKKTVIRNIIGHKTKCCVGPDISHKNQESYKVPESKEDGHIRSHVFGDKLARPEYNSIMCTINKLNEVRKQRVVTDYEHLPAGYKYEINEKISTALDFALDESIYKNLVSLSIDENQLPNRLTRSKDPEPRQKDIIPVLSDFYTPTCTEEYCSFASIKPRTPETTDSWNAFRISDKIVEWKQSVEYG